MVLLDSYFYQLQAHTGAQRFVIVRDDASRPSKDHPSCDFASHDQITVMVPPPVIDSEVRISPSRLQRRSVKLPPPKFEAQSQDYQLPCPPTRVDSVDDLVLKERTGHCFNDRSLYPTQTTSGSSGPTKISPDLRNRFKSLFGTEMHSSFVVETKKQHIAGGQPEWCEERGRIKIKALANLAAPKFPIRRGSRDDLSTLPRSRRRRRHHDLSPPKPSGDHNNNNDSANEKIDLARFLDDVACVLNDDNCVVPVDNNDELSFVVPQARRNSVHDS